VLGLGRFAAVVPRWPRWSGGVCRSPTGRPAGTATTRARGRAGASQLPVPGVPARPSFGVSMPRMLALGGVARARSRRRALAHAGPRPARRTPRRCGVGGRVRLRAVGRWIRLRVGSRGPRVARGSRCPRPLAAASQEGNADRWHRQRQNRADPQVWHAAVRGRIRAHGRARREHAWAPAAPDARSSLPAPPPYGSRQTAVAKIVCAVASVL
jgi:hypothetical protein